MFHWKVLWFDRKTDSLFKNPPNSIYASTFPMENLSLSSSSWDCCLAVNEECPVRFAVRPLSEAVAVGRSVGRTDALTEIGGV